MSHNLHISNLSNLHLGEKLGSLHLGEKMGSFVGLHHSHEKERESEVAPPPPPPPPLPRGGDEEVEEKDEDEEAPPPPPLPPKMPSNGEENIADVETDRESFQQQVTKQVSTLHNNINSKLSTRRRGEVSERITANEPFGRRETTKLTHSFAHPSLKMRSSPRCTGSFAGW